MRNLSHANSPQENTELIHIETTNICIPSNHTGVCMYEHTFLVEPDRQAEGRVSGLVLPEDAGLTVLQQLHYGQGLALGAILTGVVQGRVPHPVGGVHLATENYYVFTMTAIQMNSKV